jgi:hypothetical protein
MLSMKHETLPNEDELLPMNHATALNEDEL